jgi:hypothetical protein
VFVILYGVQRQTMDVHMRIRFLTKQPLGNFCLLTIYLLRREKDKTLAHQELEKIQQEIAALDEQISVALSGIMA